MALSTSAASSSGSLMLERQAPLSHARSCRAASRPTDAARDLAYFFRAFVIPPETYPPIGDAPIGGFFARPAFQIWRPMMIAAVAFVVMTLFFLRIITRRQ
jgi:hypothetical protein